MPGRCSNQEQVAVGSHSTRAPRTRSTGSDAETGQDPEPDNTTGEMLHSMNTIGLGWSLENKLEISDTRCII